MQKIFKFMTIILGLILGLWFLQKIKSRFLPKVVEEDQDYFTWLGAGRASKIGVGNKGALLDQARRTGLPVPRGIILLDGAWRQVVREYLVSVQDGVVTVPNPQGLIQTLGLPHFKRALAIRSAFSAEDRAGESLAGFFTSKLFVNPDDPAAIAAALAEVWASALKHPGQFRHDVLVMEMVEALQAGVAFTEREFEDDLINYTDGTADALVSGRVAGLALLLPKLRFWEGRGKPAGKLLPLNLATLAKILQSPTAADHPPFAIRLQRLLRDVRRAFGPRDWDIEWADEGRHSWLIQIRPITRPTRRNEAFTSANFKEILPDLPSRFTTTLIAACSDEIFGYYRGFDRSLPQQRPMSEIFYGRPLFNISLLTEMMRRWGLPTRLVTGNIGGETDQEYGLNLGRFLASTVVLLKVGWAQARAVPSAHQTIQLILERTAQVDPTFTTCVETLHWLYSTLVTEMFSLTSAMSGPLLLLRRFDTLAEHNARQHTITTEMFTDLEPLRTLAARIPTIRAALEQDSLPDHPEFGRLWQAYLDKHGHRGVYESDIARPRLREAPEALLKSLAQPTGHRQRPSPRTLAGRLTLPIWWQASRNMRTREELRYHAIIGFDRVRHLLLTLADQAVIEGILPHRESLWLLEIDEVRQLDQGWRPNTDFFEQRRREIEHLKNYDLPDLFYRFDDLEQYNDELQGPMTGNNHRFKGLSLTGGQVRGKAWVLNEPDTELPAGFTAEQTILVARSVDAGWIPTFGQVAGAVVEIGGDLSHGSIILREIGLPAITNIRGATRAIQTGDELVLQAGVGLVERR